MGLVASQWIKWMGGFDIKEVVMRLAHHHLSIGYDRGRYGVIDQGVGPVRSKLAAAMVRSRMFTTPSPLTSAVR